MGQSPPLEEGRPLKWMEANGHNDHLLPSYTLAIMSIVPSNGDEGSA
jgi:hypothetical protein